MSKSSDLSASLSALAHAVATLAAALARLPTPPAAPAPLAHSLPPAPEPCALVDLVNSFLLAKARAGRSDRYLRQLRVSLSSFVSARPVGSAALVTPADVEKWLQRPGWKPRTRAGYLSDLRTCFAWGVRRGLVASNPAAAVDVPQARPVPVFIHSPSEVRAVLVHVLARDVGAARLLAVRYFAGVRSAEALRLVEEDLAGGFVRVEAEKAKTRRRRLVPVSENLAAWLALAGGPLPVSDKRLRRALAGCPAPWPANVTRHSFVSYHLAGNGSAAGTALAAGHTESVLFSCYRELTTPAVAAEFWRIIPPGPDRPALPAGPVLPS